MREVAWVVFDEIHYMRDASEYSKKCDFGTCRRADYAIQFAVWFGKKPSFSSPIKFDMCFCLQQFPMPCSLPNGLQRCTTSHAMSFIPISVRRHSSTTFTPLGLKASILSSMRMAGSVKRISRMR